MRDDIFCQYLTAGDREEMNASIHQDGILCVACAP